MWLKVDYRIVLVLVFFRCFDSAAIIVAYIFKTRNNLTGFLREVTREGEWFVCFPLMLLQLVLPTAQRQGELLVGTLLVCCGKSFIWIRNLTLVRLVFTFLLSWWVHSLALLVDLQGELVGLGVNKGFCSLKLFSTAQCCFSSLHTTEV